MMKRWMKSIVAASKAESSELPFHRNRRLARDTPDTQQAILRKSA